MYHSVFLIDPESERDGWLSEFYGALKVELPNLDSMTYDGTSIPRVMYLNTREPLGNAERDLVRSVLARFGIRVAS